MRYFLKLAYDGTDFHGWQRQPNAVSVQQTLEEAISTILQHPTEVTGAGRTDTGVHAAQMFAHFDSDKPIEKCRLLTSLNRMAGKAIAVEDILPVRDDAHARFDAESRTYVYHISERKNPFSYRYSHFMEHLPDMDKMNEAASLLLATEDFTAFAKLHSDAKTGICKVSEAQWTYDEKKGCLDFTITADRFLRNMVRAVVGTLVDVGRMKLSLEDFKEVIESKDRCKAGVSMPAKGLFLNKIVYPKEIFIL